MVVVIVGISRTITCSVRATKHDHLSNISIIVIPRIMVRGISYTVHGLVPASCVFADRYNREEVVRSFGREINLNPPLVLGQLPDIPEELLKLDQASVWEDISFVSISFPDSEETEKMQRTARSLASSRKTQ